jgi:hypothetical protein
MTGAGFGYGNFVELVHSAFHGVIEPHKYLAALAANDFTRIGLVRINQNVILSVSLYFDTVSNLDV